jgi:tetratricopeptide (TPR) repeat protein
MITMANMAQVHEAQGEYDKAQYEKVLPLFKATLGEEQPVATTRGSKALMYNSQGQYDKALSLFEESLRT